VLVLIVAILAGLLAGYALGGRLGNLERLAMATQIVIFSPLGEPLGETACLLAHLGSYILLLAFVVMNRRDPGITFAGVGIVANFLVIVANRGYMPASQRALDLAGFATTSDTHNNSAVAHQGSHLLVLGDVMAVPGGIPFVSNVFSVGDVLIAGGVAMILAMAMRGPDTVPTFRAPTSGGRAETS